MEWGFIEQTFHKAYNLFRNEIFRTLLHEICSGKNFSEHMKYFQKKLFRKFFISAFSLFFAAGYSAYSNQGVQ